MIPDICKILHKKLEYMAVLATQKYFWYIIFDYFDIFQQVNDT